MRTQVTLRSRSADETREVGSRLAQFLQAGDLVILAGDLGAGKTTLVQGLGAAMNVRGRVTSPTYIVARVHPALSGGPDLIHVDAYRVEDALDLETIDLDTELEHSVTVVEWGAGKVEALAPERFEIHFGDEDDGEGGEDTRQIRIVAVGEQAVTRLRKASGIFGGASDGLDGARSGDGLDDARSGGGLDGASAGVPGDVPTGVRGQTEEGQ